MVSETEQSTWEFTTYNVRFSCLACGHVGNSLTFAPVHSVLEALIFPKPVVSFLLYLITVAAFFHEIDLCKSFTENITDILAFYGAST